MATNTAEFRLGDLFVQQELITEEQARAVLAQVRIRKVTEHMESRQSRFDEIKARAVKVRDLIESDKALLGNLGVTEYIQEEDPEA